MRKLNKRIVLSILLVVALVGVGATIALSLAQSNKVTNTFEAADHDTSIEEEVDGLKKTVQVKNDADKSPAYIRVRFEISPEDAVWEKNINYTIEGTNWEYDEQDDFYYYLKPVEAGGETLAIIFNVKNQENIKESFDVLVYEESCVATSDLGGMDNEEKLNKIKAAFAEADGKNN